jgi:hypothetical protein
MGNGGEFWGIATVIFRTDRLGVREKYELVKEPAHTALRAERANARASSRYVPAAAAFDEFEEYEGR